MSLVSPQTLPVGSRISSSPCATIASAARSATSQQSRARPGADGIPPNHPKPASGEDLYTQAAATRYKVNFKKEFTYGFATGGQAQQQKAERFSGKLADLANQIKDPDRSQVACKILVVLANQHKDPVLANNAQVVLEAVWGKAQRDGESTIIEHLHQAYQLNFTPNLRALQQLETRTVNSAAPSSRGADKTEPASSREVLNRQKTECQLKLKEHYKAAENSAKNKEWGQLTKGLSVVAGFVAVGLTIAFPIAILGVLPALIAFRRGDKQEQRCQKAYLDSIQECRKLETQIKSIETRLAKS